MQIDFVSERLRDQCQNTRTRQKLFGAESAKRLQTRLDDMDAAPTLEDLRNAPGKWEELSKDRKGQFSCRLHGGLRLIFRPTQLPPPVKPDGGLDWAAIDRITILEVGDYHD